MCVSCSSPSKTKLELMKSPLQADIFPVFTQEMDSDFKIHVAMKSKQRLESLTPVLLARLFCV